jgi:hypothetical protein
MGILSKWEVWGKTASYIILYSALVRAVVL